MLRNNKIAVLIPCYNEAQTINKVICDWRTALSTVYQDVQIYVYDNNSTDKTAEIAEKAGAIVVKEKKQGKGNVVRSMFRDINADCYFMVDGDDTYSSGKALEMAGLILDGHTDMVVGDRLSSTYFTENTRRFHGFGNNLVRKCVNLIFKSNVTDIMTGCRAFSPKFVKNFPVISRGFEIEVEMTIHALDKNLNIESIAVDYKEREIPEESKLRTIPDGMRVMLTIFDLFKGYRPLLFFGLLAMLFAAISIALFLPVLDTYARTGLVYRLPTLIVSCFIFLSSILSLFTGIIMDQIHKKEQKDYEYMLLHN